MSIAVTGATGHLGRLVVESLLQRGVPADQIIATGRDTAKIADLHARGVTVVHADYADPESLVAAFSGAEKLLLVSGSEIGQRAIQHRAAIDAAKRAGVRFVVYTSIAKADTSSLSLAQEHLATEIELANSGLDHAILRNGWYLENYTDQLATYLAVGVAGAAGDGRISAATRKDFAEAAAAVLLSDVPSGTVYELGGEGFTMTELAAEVSRVSGQKVEYTNLDEATYAGILAQAGVPDVYATMLADSDRGAAIGDLEVDSAPLTALLNRPPTTLSTALDEAFARSKA